MRPHWTTLRYRDGYGRRDRGGLVELTLWSDQHVRLMCPRPGSGALAFEGLLEGWVFPELCSLLADAGFPALQRPQEPAHDPTSLLSGASAEGTMQAWIWPFHRQLPAIAHSLLLLEGVASALSDGAVSDYRPFTRPVLRPR